MLSGLDNNVKIQNLSTPIIPLPKHLTNTKYMDSLIKPYNDRRASFGRHETFSLRYAWLTKGFQAFMKKKAIFSSDEATIELDVGKNRVNELKD